MQISRISFHHGGTESTELLISCFPNVIRDEQCLPKNIFDFNEKQFDHRNTK